MIKGDMMGANGMEIGQVAVSVSKTGKGRKAGIVFSRLLRDEGVLVRATAGEDVVYVDRSLTPMVLMTEKNDRLRQDEATGY